VDGRTTLDRKSRGGGLTGEGRCFTSAEGEGQRSKDEKE